MESKCKTCLGCNKQELDNKHQIYVIAPMIDGENSDNENVAALEEKVAELEDRTKRQMAEFENFRKRTEKEKSMMFETGAKSVIEKILPVIDNFERSLNVQTPSEEIATFLKGYQMIFDQFMNILNKNGVEVIEALGKEFDPNFHQAVMMANDENYGSNIVVEELQKGYKLKDRVIRASLVKVNE